ncbi:hypothetical protein A3I99_00550 [Candidatus Kaiserbacteria bacterium RIFCSPLOWO2_02_FULL_45_11b]|uniref:Uncharacterized protein n=1 Tax=Candidatus Kaiserbacteria bacterium RIFCSPLOWO2_12_FULL_45_26 TaxID=1798525 RepID=A0A1F6FG95_9BACT|nr:MAG: hypothetical protein A2Z56_03095 [Candidatus Kaiserbacteria bacterium RIFCSPHIGHO2_12_45_16]OGG70936.1 MAG: hypothetical protein A2929_00960 [Candidatus Kaiserbacteria bacterium RIFCSPLOWO2_01_FULL_45_25]OGG84266.1 MAG: hypothetical protein A3I99_00550 [Candidatus Kaiserbacteria bacterium RIFCSPLOWO2_02_FULL_45_11b]OGG84880.1 MAG: hypothetical protein A3G90_02285 [Candidatus Kaiserbacteria bacterium RIFCSPLOWO2_12_FULL_45_26]
MRKFLQNIYRKPKEVRDNYALVTAGVFTMVVCVFWVTARLQAPINGDLIVSDSISPFATLIKKSKEQLAALKAASTEEPIVDQGAPTPAATTTAANLILTEEDKATASAKASSTATSSQEVQYKEVLIGTTTATTTEQ